MTWRTYNNCWYYQEISQTACGQQTLHREKCTTLSNQTTLHIFTSSMVTYMHNSGSTVPCPPGYMQRKAFPSSSAWIFPAGVSSPPHLSISTSDGSVSFDKLATESWLATVTSCPLAFLSTGSAHGTFCWFIALSYKKTTAIYSSI